MPSRRGARPKNTSSVHYIAIKSPMSCGACASTVKDALLKVPGITAVEVHLSDQLAIATSEDDGKGCASINSECKRGDKRQCMTKALVAASRAVGFDASGTGSRALGKGSGSQGSSEGKAIAAADARVRNVAIGVALLAVAWVAAKRFAKQ